jgi:phage-related protein (TIGR01555 family)
MRLPKIFKPWTWFKKEIKPETKPEEKAESTTDLSMERARRTGALNQWIHQNMFQKTHDDIVAINRGGETIGMDSAVAMDSADIKGAYSLSSGNLPQILFSWYIQQGFIGYQACAVIAQQWLVDKACKVPAEDAIKNGYDLTVNDGTDVDPQVLKDLRDFDKKYKLHKNLVEFSRFNRVFGIRIAIFKVESTDPDYYLKPFNIDGVTSGSYKGISQVDPYWITPELDGDAVGNPASPDFYEPTWWRVSGKRYHRSHLIIIRHSEVADVLKPSYIYGGIPLPQMIYERIYAAERTANEAPQLALTKRMNILKTDMAKAMANQSAFEERLQQANTMRDNFGVWAIDEDDTYEQSETTLTDLDSLIMTQYQLVAAIARMPGTKLLGTSPKGFNATGEFETETYYDLLECIQGDDSELLERHYELLIKSEGLKSFNFEINWKPLKSSSPTEIADINSKNAITDQAVQLTGAIDGRDIRNRLIADPNSGYNGLEAFEEPEE